MPVHPVFLEPVRKVNTQSAEIAEKMPLFRPAADASRYAAWLNNESAERALRLYRAAYDIAHPNSGTPTYYVALVPGGNHAAVGFRIESANGVFEHPGEPYILLDPEPSRFETTLLHETGHMAMALMAGGRQLEGTAMASIPHSTAALSDRNTAYSEGYAIHLETLEAHAGRDPAIRARYRQEPVVFGEAPYHDSEYFRNAADLTSYSQSLARYQEVRDNVFAFEGAFQGPDYLRVQLEKARNFAELRNPDQLLQSEGFYATFFFRYVMRGATVPDAATLDERERQILLAMRAAFAGVDTARSSPWLPKLVISYLKQFPEQKDAVIAAINDLSHGVFVDASAAQTWKDHYLSALALDIERLNIQGINKIRKGWNDRVSADPDLLFSRLGPEIPCTVPGTKVRLAALESEEPVQFDVNTVQPGILRLIPGISEAEVSGWQAERNTKPFASVEDFRARGFLKPGTLAALRF